MCAYELKARKKVDVMTMLKGDLSEEAAFAAFAARDRRMDGRFVIGVKSTRIYCKPSCPARRPRPENVVLFADAAAALEAGYLRNIFYKNHFE